MLEINKRYSYILVDIGNVIFHDLPIHSALGYEVFSRLKSDFGFTIDQFFKYRNKEMSKGNKNWIYDLIANKYKDTSSIIISETWESVLKIWTAINIPIKNSIESIQKLSDLTKVIIAANQPIQTLDVLKKYRICNESSLVFVDAMMNYSKPDLNFYKHILNEINANPANTLMIGDRFDNDIIPAKKLNMKTLFIDYNLEDYKFEEIVTQAIPISWQKIYYENVKIVPINNSEFEKDISDYRFRFIDEFVYSISY